MASVTETHLICLKGQPYSYSLIRRRNQRHINLRISYEGELIVSVPSTATIKKIRSVLEHKEAWIVKHLTKMRDAITTIDPLQKILLYGEIYTVEKKPGNKRSSVTVRRKEKKIVLKYIDPSGEAMRNQLKGWLKRTARKELTETIARFSAMVEIPYNTVHIRDQKTRWGSSSGRGVISINWRIIMAPEYVRNYLIVHELVHQIHRNHQKKFWTEVAERFPDYGQAEMWLKDNSLLLAVLR